MPPKNNSTPIKPSKGSTMIQEDEETQHEISKLQEQVHLSQRETKNEMEVLKKGVETKMDGLQKGMEAKLNGLEVNMDGMEAKIDEKIKENITTRKRDIGEG